jgi:hypothetical protein
MDITHFFGRQNTTPTARSVEVATTDTSTASQSQGQGQGQSGSTPIINKVLFGASTTSISAKKDHVLQAQAVPASKSRLPPHSVSRVPPPTIIVKTETAASSEGIIPC